MRITIVLLLSSLSCLAQSGVTPPASPRVAYGKQRLAAVAGGGRSFVVKIDSTAGPKEYFNIDVKGNTAHITGADASGALYGCLALADEVKAHGWPRSFHLADSPRMVLRGACIGLQKPTLLPGRGPYEYPYTPQNFPWFYDKGLWRKYLDSMVDNRLNTLYLWNGHPFASLVRLPEYPYAVEVDDSTFKKNEEVYRWLTAEADKRGIWVIQLFYNIIVSKPFAEHNHLKTQDRNRHIIPLIADYTRKSIAAFVKKYPNVGLMFTLGEAMEGVGQDDIDWLTKTIIPGIRDGLRAAGRTDEPPIVLRAHDTDGPADLRAAMPLYKNLYVEAKYNGEALTTYTPHGAWADLHRQLSQLSKGLIENVHIMANLEPFRYGSPDFIQKCVQAMHKVYGANSLHLYPQASYWDWPYAADSVTPATPTAAPATSTATAASRESSRRLLEMDRDWIWYKAWARYAWNSDRPRDAETSYWTAQLSAKYGCDSLHARAILDAYEQSGEISPKLLRRFGITDGNRQTMTLGEFMTQLIDPERYGLFTLLYESEGPPGESLAEYAEKEWKHLPHTGETPVDVINSVRAEAAAAVTAIDRAAGLDHAAGPGPKHASRANRTAGPSDAITSNRAEFARLRNDIYCYRALAEFYAAKAEAALFVLRYNYSNDLADLDKALSRLQTSVGAFRMLKNLAAPAYRYANSMQTQQRKIPIRGANGKFITWQEMLPLYEEEANHFKTHLDSLKTATGRPAAAPKMLEPAIVQCQNPTYSMDSGARPFTDTALTINAFTPLLKKLKGLQTISADVRKQGTKIVFTCTEPVDLLIGFFNRKSSAFTPPPQLETDASANDYGQAEPRITNAVIVKGMPPVNVHTWSFQPGTHTLELGKGLCLILGFAKQQPGSKPFDAGMNEPGKKNLDWLFE
ncbi:hypothetical protein [Puia sp.]|jgi:hypothetical protein|uniref:hypothetical protein n=1 Tax=Puia sp. TaxID=2045100 RepID=UPI002F3ECDDD